LLLFFSLSFLLSFLLFLSFLQHTQSEVDVMGGWTASGDGGDDGDDGVEDGVDGWWMMDD